MGSRFKITGIGVMLVTFFFVAGCRNHKPAKLTTDSPRGFSVKVVPQSARQRELERFLKRDFINQDAISTSLVAEKSGGEKATGREYLLESASLWLLHLCYTNRFSEFRAFYKTVDETFSEKGYMSYRYNPKTKKRYSVNATGDDLRLIRALVAYDEATGTSHYKKEIARLYRQWQEKCFPNAELRDYYDGGMRRVSPEGSLAYCDLQLLGYLPAKKTTVKKTEKLVHAGYLGDSLPLYYSSYNWTDSAYNSKAINMSEAFEVLLELARAGQLRETSRSWLVKQLESGYIPNQFSPSGTILDANESVANLALLAQIFATLHDEPHYLLAMKLVWQQQQTSGELRGGFGDEHTGQAYSYNNLNVLIAADLRGQVDDED